MTLITNPAMYVVVYMGLMVPTYVLPYFGSNSVTTHTVAEVASVAMGVSSVWLHLTFYLHLGCLLGLCGLTLMRGKSIDRVWLPVFPFLALVFDLTPVLSWIPLVPTAMHLLAVILAVAGIQQVSDTRVTVAVN